MSLEEVIDLSDRNSVGTTKVPRLLWRGCCVTLSDTCLSGVLCLLKGFQRAVVVAHSFGTWLTLRLNAELPGVFGGMVLVGPYLPPPNAQPKAPGLFKLPGWILSLLQVNQYHAANFWVQPSVYPIWNRFKEWLGQLGGIHLVSGRFEMKRTANMNKISQDHMYK